MKKNNLFDISQDVFLRNEKAYKLLLDTRCFDIVYLRSIKGQSYTDISKKYGVSSTRIRQLFAKSYDMIEKAGYL